MSIVNRNIQTAQQKQKKYYDQKHRPNNLECGMLVMLHTPHVEAGKSQKLAKLWKGPYRILKQEGELNVLIRHTLNPQNQQ